MSDPARARRLADRIREIVAELLEREVKDPRLGFVTVTDTRLTADLRDATIFYTVYGDEEAWASTAVALHSAAGVLRAQVGRRLGLRFTPTVSFVADAIPDHAQHIEDLLARAHAVDARVSAVAEQAQPAGDPDPYRWAEPPDVGSSPAESAAS